MFLASTRLALIACRYLTRAYYENRYVPAPEMAGEYNMNVRALMPALKQLTRAGLLRSRTGGREPGFILSRCPREIHLLDVIAALEGDKHFECCYDVISDIKCDCSNHQACEICTLFQGIEAEAKSRLARVSLREYSKLD